MQVITYGRFTELISEIPSTSFSERTTTTKPFGMAETNSAGNQQSTSATMTNNVSQSAITNSKASLAPQTDSQARIDVHDAFIQGQMEHLDSDALVPRRMRRSMRRIESVEALDLHPSDDNLKKKQQSEVPEASHPTSPDNVNAETPQSTGPQSPRYVFGTTMMTDSELVRFRTIETDAQLFQEFDTSPCKGNKRIADTLRRLRER